MKHLIFSACIAALVAVPLHAQPITRVKATLIGFDGKVMTLNTGDELVRIAGLVRADDIATDNTVSSTRVADARITYSGTGSFADASQPGWFDRFFLSPLFPF